MAPNVSPKHQALERSGTVLARTGGHGVTDEVVKQSAVAGGQEAHKPQGQQAIKSETHDPLSPKANSLFAFWPMAGNQGADGPINPKTDKLEARGREAERPIGPMACGIEDFGATPYCNKQLADELRA
jgi:hypothetical protein